MKKFLQVSVLLFCAVSFMGCPKGPTKTVEVESISITPKHVVLNANETSIRLNLEITPAEAKKDAKIAWSSNDTAVASVSTTGYVEAQGLGSCYIYAESENGKKDSCLVEVKSYLESLIFNSAIIWNEDTTYAYDSVANKYIVDTITSTSGDTYYAYRALAHLRIFSDGFYVNNSGYLDGTATGTVIDVYAPMYYATAYLNHAERGTIFCLGEWDVTDNIQHEKQCKPGKISNEAEYIQNISNFVDAVNDGENASPFAKAAGELFEGATLSVWNYDADNEGYFSSYIPDAVCDEAHISLNGEFAASQYMCGLDYSIVKFTPLDYYWGMVDVAADESLYLVDGKIHWGDQITSTYGEMPAASAQKAYAPINVPIISEHPELAARLEKQIKERGNMVIKKKF